MVTPAITVGRRERRRIAALICHSLPYCGNQ
jgi:hypothetical protein